MPTFYHFILEDLFREKDYLLLFPRILFFPVQFLYQNKFCMSKFLCIFILNS